MPVFCCTSRLAKRLGVTLASEFPAPGGRLGEWYANTLNVGSRRYVICISAQTLLPVIMPVRKSDFPGRFPDHLRTILRGVGIPAAAIDSELMALGAVVFAKTRQRSLIGSLNEFIHCAAIFLERGESIDEAALRLSDMPCGVLDHGCPAEATFDVLSAGDTP
ncbi:MAG: hypothetical protein R3F20_13875 [Planctomycetota bacterium]